jgi:hypothetical protein
MKLEQALNIIKQALDQAVKIGVCANIDSAGVLAQAWLIVTQTIKQNEEKN